MGDGRRRLAITAAGFDRIGYDLSFKSYVDRGGTGYTAIAVNRATKKRRTMTDRCGARNCEAIALRLLVKLQSEAA